MSTLTGDYFATGTVTDPRQDDARDRSGHSIGCAAVPPGEMLANAQDAAGFLKALAHEGRLMILCHLGSGEKSVTELENLLHSRQAAVSQQLARLRGEGLVSCRREGKAIYYSLSDARAQALIGTIYELFCKPE